MRAKTFLGALAFLFLGTGSAFGSTSYMCSEYSAWKSQTIEDGAFAGQTVLSPAGHLVREFERNVRGRGEQFSYYLGHHIVFCDLACHSIDGVEFCR